MCIGLHLHKWLPIMIDMNKAMLDPESVFMGYGRVTVTVTETFPTDKAEFMDGLEKRLGSWLKTEKPGPSQRVID